MNIRNYNLEYVEKLTEELLLQSNEEGKEGLVELISIASNDSNNTRLREVSEAAYEGAKKIFQNYRKLSEKDLRKAKDQNAKHSILVDLDNYDFFIQNLEKFPTFTSLNNAAISRNTKLQENWKQLGKLIFESSGYY